MTDIAINPYQTPEANLVWEVPERVDAESIRRKHLSREANLKAAGALYWLNGIVIALAGLAVPLVFTPDSAGMAVLVAAGMLALIALGIFYCHLGNGLRKFKRWVRIPVAILSGLAMTSPPIGTLIHGAILYVVFSRKGKTVLSEEYQEVVAQTPHMKYKTPIIAWVALALVLAVPVAMVVLG